MPFAENAVYILDMLEKISDQNVFEAAYMNRVLFCAQEYQKRVERLNFSKVVLTAREKEILGLLERGCKHEEIDQKPEQECPGEQKFEYLFHTVPPHRRKRALVPMLYSVPYFAQKK